jgi:hypothetical protein
MIVSNVVEVISNGKKLVLKLSHSLSSASDYSEYFDTKVNVETRRIKTERDYNVEEQTYEITALSNDAEVKITIIDDNPFDMSAHTDHVIFRYNGEKWESKWILHPKYH